MSDRSQKETQCMALGETLARGYFGVLLQARQVLGVEAVKELSSEVRLNEELVLRPDGLYREPEGQTYESEAKRLANCYPLATTERSVAVQLGRYFYREGLLHPERAVSVISHLRELISHLEKETQRVRQQREEALDGSDADSAAATLGAELLGADLAQS